MTEEVKAPTKIPREAIDALEEQMVRARFHLLFKKPFLGSIIAQLELCEASSWCRTCSTDGRKFYYNFHWASQLTLDNLKFVFGHQILHLCLDHLGRRGTRDIQVWGMATDYLVNYILKKEAFGVPPTNANILLDDRFTDEMSADEIYAYLIDNQIKIEIPMDDHLDASDGDDGKDGKGKSSNSVTVSIAGGPDGPPKLTEEDINQIRNDIMQQMMTAAQSMSAGDVPGFMQRYLDDLNTPKMDWRALLSVHIKSTVKGDYSFSNPSKRSWHLGVILPGVRNVDTIDVAVSIDTSGSMTNEMLTDFLSEVKGIMDEFEDFNLWLWTFDTRVYQPKLFTPHNLDEIMEYVPEGGGGTYFTSNWEFMKDPSSHGFDDLSPIEPKCFIMFTDGYDGGDCGLAHEEWTKTLFVIHSNYDAFDPGFGETAFYDKY